MDQEKDMKLIHRDGTRHSPPVQDSANASHAGMFKPFMDGLFNFP
jgi:hypothetical protein